MHLRPPLADDALRSCANLSPLPTRQKETINHRVDYQRWTGVRYDPQPIRGRGKIQGGGGEAQLVSRPEK